MKYGYGFVVLWFVKFVDLAVIRTWWFLFQCMDYGYVAYMDYMDLDVRCRRRLLNIVTHTITWWFVWYIVYLTKTFRVASLTFGQLYDYPNSIEVTLKDMHSKTIWVKPAKISWFLTTRKHNTAWTLCIILGNCSVSVFISIAVWL